MAEFLQRLGSSGTLPEYAVPAAGQEPLKYDDASRKDAREMIALQSLIREGHYFSPTTNLSTNEGMKRTKSCYTNILNKTRGEQQGIQPNTNYVKTNSGKTGYVSVPNKSQKILSQAYKVESKTLTHQGPLDLKTEPMKSLKGCVYTEMV